MSFTTTTNFNLTKPDVGTEDDAWGGEVNANMDKIDAALTTQSNEIAALQSQQTTNVWQ